tara:strand:- start:177 stop:935 length:759 start_codon:yes stop_codon:yes gene_type:complete
MKKNIILSLTSIPRRLNTSTLEVIGALKKQSVKCNILINIPIFYKKWGKPHIPDEIKNDDDIILWTPKQDYGSATKLIGALEYVQEHSEIDYIITVDDDLYYKDNDYVKYMISYSDKYPNFALTIGGIKLIKYPYRSGNGLKYGNKGFVDIPSGYLGVLYPVKPFIKNNIIFNFFNKLPEGIFNDDDAYFGIILSIMRIPLLSIPKYPGLTKAQGAGKSAVQEKAKKHRKDNEMEIFQFAVSKGYLPNKNIC